MLPIQRPADPGPASSPAAAAPAGSAADSAGGEPSAFALAAPWNPLPGAPRLTQASAPLLREITIQDEYGERRTIHIPAERPLTVFVDRRELVTLMTLGASPELLVLGWLINQRLVDSVAEVESVTVDWAVSAAAVRTHAGIADLDRRTARRVVTTGCGQGTVFGDAMEQLGALRLPDAATARIRQGQLAAMLETMRQRNSVHRKAGSVHGCALFSCRDAGRGGSEMLMFVEDVGRHNAVDAIAGWMWLEGVDGADKVFYTTGRLTSEMVIKAAQMGIPFLVSRSGLTKMGHEIARTVGITLIGRAVNRRYLVFTGAERLVRAPAPAKA